MKWDELTPQQKAALGREYVRGGVYSVDKMREHYESVPDDPPDNDTIYRAKSPLKPVIITAEHPLWSYPEYKRLKNNPNIQRHKDALYAFRVGHEKAGRKYLQTTAQVLSALSYLTGLGEASLFAQFGIKGLIKAFGKEIARNAPQYIMQTPDIIMDANDPDAVSLILDSPGRIMSKVDDAIPLGKFSFIKYSDNFIPELGAAYDAYGAVKTISDEEEN